MSNNDSPSKSVRQEKSPHYRSIHPIGHIMGSNADGDVKVVFFSDGLFIPDFKDESEDDSNVEPVHLYEVELFLLKEHAEYLAQALQEITNADAEADYDQ